MPNPGPAPLDAESLAKSFRAIRAQTEHLCEPLLPEDFLLQAMPDASPAKWHLAHTTWFYEAFLLPEASPGYRPVREDVHFLFNSYYNAIGDRVARDKRGLMSRPSIDEVRLYRDEVNRRVLDAILGFDRDALHRLGPIVELGLNHEEQHQELLLTDLKVAFGWNPTRPVYRESADSPPSDTIPLTWIEGGGEVAEVGHAGSGFAFDNETPRHRVFLEPFAIASRLATNAEYLAFMDEGGYQRPEFWLSDGWAARNANGWVAPMYWEGKGGAWRTFTLGGMKPVVDSEPVAHLSFYEADAFARWSGARLPTEAEWETVARGVPIEPAGFLESGRLHPSPARTGNPKVASQMFGDVWEWTASPYVAYPGYRPAAGALGEYNGKFMCNQMVLRGGSCATSIRHVRPTYRNFFPPSSRWQFSGVRLGRDV